MKTVVIANPKAAGGKVGRKWVDYSRAIAAVMGPGETRLTGARGEATPDVGTGEAARDAAYRARELRRAQGRADAG